MRILIYGGRDFHDYELLYSTFIDWAYGIEYPEEGRESFWDWDQTIISGRAKGADQLGERLACEECLDAEIYPADWETHGKAAGPIRNQQMLDSGIDVAFECPGGKGTADMRRRLDKAGIRVFEVRND